MDSVGMDFEFNVDERIIVFVRVGLIVHVHEVFATPFPDYRA
jgi:hypothetical protein